VTSFFRDLGHKYIFFIIYFKVKKIILTSGFRPSAGNKLPALDYYAIFAADATGLANTKNLLSG